jgi:hypothetical protein
MRETLRASSSNDPYASFSITGVLKLKLAFGTYIYVYTTAVPRFERANYKYGIAVR